LVSFETPIDGKWSLADDHVGISSTVRRSGRYTFLAAGRF
jgi:hypothetical protein